MPNPKLDKAIKDCKAYRKYLKEKGIPQHLATKGFLVTSEMITNLMKQNGGNIDGIRIYVGLDDSTSNKEIIPYAVACVKNEASGKYDDYKVPKGQQQAAVDAPMAATTTSMGDATNTTLTSTSISTEGEEPVVENPRPCPSECGEANDLNSGD
jgi:hypothetical protein